MGRAAADINFAMRRILPNQRQRSDYFSLPGGFSHTLSSSHGEWRVSFGWTCAGVGKVADGVGASLELVSWNQLYDGWNGDGADEELEDGSWKLAMGNGHADGVGVALTRLIKLRWSLFGTQVSLWDTRWLLGSVVEV